MNIDLNNGFVKWIKPPQGGRKSPLVDLEVGECWFLQETYSIKLYRRIYGIEKRYPGRTYSYKKIKNGIIIKRDA